ncbi:MAG TPA: imidazole glycerol phosphate synthase cyclase subunit [Patescibacteria group bacterium]|nr:imidazole glycerol phosphate synthase cyclase subunit [Patescibacteria group bacterium]
MLTVRIIPKLEVKNENLIKGIHLEGLRIVGKPQLAALKYAADGADELIYIDLVASLYQRDNWLNIVKRTAEQIYIPLTVGGGIKSVDDARLFLRAGADKVAINTAIIKNTKLVTAVARKFGSQAMVASLEVQKKLDGSYEIYTDSGRTPTGVNPIPWAKEVEKLGAGEILLTFIHQDGTYQGYDLDLLTKISSAAKIPVIASGGGGSIDDLIAAVTLGKADALAIASLLHFNKLNIGEIKQGLKKAKIPVRL